MRKLLKIVSGLVLLIVVAAIVAPMMIDPNDYREQIQTVVKEKTGRDLAINGDLSVSLFPWIGIGLNEVILSNAVGFKAAPFAKIQEANVKVKLLPLLSQHVEVSTVVLKGMSLNLEKNQAGKTNWDDMVQSSTEPDATKGKPTEQSVTLAMAPIAIGGLQIVDANITWDDASKGERYSLAGLDLSPFVGEPNGR